jgi:hypothetical protein
VRSPASHILANSGVSAIIKSPSGMSGRSNEYSLSSASARGDWTAHVSRVYRGCNRLLFACKLTYLLSVHADLVFHGQLCVHDGFLLPSAQPCECDSPFPGASLCLYPCCTASCLNAYCVPSRVIACSKHTRSLCISPVPFHRLSASACIQRPCPCVIAFRVAFVGCPVDVAVLS